MQNVLSKEYEELSRVSVTQYHYAQEAPGKSKEPGQPITLNVTVAEFMDCGSRAYIKLGGILAYDQYAPEPTMSAAS